jgi:hypothetical protein
MHGLPGLIGQLFDDALALAWAEVRLAKSRAYDLLRRSRIALALLAAAFLIALGSIVALMLGLVLALAPLVGAALAGVILLVAGLGISGLLVWLAMREIGGSPGKTTPKPQQELIP